MARGDIKEHADNIFNAGCYNVGGASNGVPSSYGILIVFNTGAWYDTIQIYFGFSSKKASYRIHQSTWSDWVDLN